jgi:hypothetical protein
MRLQRIKKEDQHSDRTVLVVVRKWNPSSLSFLRLSFSSSENKTRGIEVNSGVLGSYPRHVPNFKERRLVFFEPLFVHGYTCFGKIRSAGVHQHYMGRALAFDRGRSEAPFS